MKIKNLLTISIALVLASCAYNPEKYVNISKEKVLPRASFEMGCPEEEIEVKVLTENEVGYPETLGLTGCNRKLVYMRLDGETDWFLNFDSKRKNQ